MHEPADKRGGYVASECRRTRSGLPPPAPGHREPPPLTRPFRRLAGDLVSCQALRRGHLVLWRGRSSGEGPAWDLPASGTFSPLSLPKAEPMGGVWVSPETTVITWYPKAVSHSKRPFLGRLCFYQCFTKSQHLGAPQWCSR